MTIDSAKQKKERKKLKKVTTIVSLYLPSNKTPCQQTGVNFKTNGDD